MNDAIKPAWAKPKGVVRIALNDEPLPPDVPYMYDETRFDHAPSCSDAARILADLQAHRAFIHPVTDDGYLERLATVAQGGYVNFWDAQRISRAAAGFDTKKSRIGNTRTRYSVFAMLIWSRYRAARLIYVGGRAGGMGRALSTGIALFEFFRPNPSIRISVKKNQPLK